MDRQIRRLDIRGGEHRRVLAISFLGVRKHRILNMDSVAVSSPILMPICPSLNTPKPTAAHTAVPIRPMNTPAMRSPRPLGQSDQAGSAQSSAERKNEADQPDRVAGAVDELEIEVWALRHRETPEHHQAGLGAGGGKAVSIRFRPGYWF